MVILYSLKGNTVWITWNKCKITVGGDSRGRPQLYATDTTGKILPATLGSIDYTTIIKEIQDACRKDRQLQVSGNNFTPLGVPVRKEHGKFELMFSKDIENANSSPRTPASKGHLRNMQRDVTGTTSSGKKRSRGDIVVPERLSEASAALALIFSENVGEIPELSTEQPSSIQSALAMRHKRGEKSSAQLIVDAWKFATRTDLSSYEHPSFAL
jgi:hypothetical protein